MRPAAGRYTRAASAPIHSSPTACISGPRERARARCAIPSRIAATSNPANGGDGCATNAANCSSANGPGTPRCYQRPGRIPGPASLPLAELIGSKKPTTLYVTFPKYAVEGLGSFLRILGAQFARGLRDAAARRPTLIAFSGPDVLGPNPLLDIATSPTEGVELATGSI